MKIISSELYVPGPREGWVESTRFTRVVSPTGTLGLGAAFGAVSGNSIVTRRVQDGGSCHTKLHIPETQDDQ